MIIILILRIFVDAFKIISGHYKIFFIYFNTPPQVIVLLQIHLLGKKKCNKSIVEDFRPVGPQ
jgi:hypothetical protein